MKTNDKMRKKLTGSLRPNEQIEATVALTSSIGPASGGVASMARAHDAADRRTHAYRYLDTFLPGSELKTRLRYDLADTWFTLTDQRAMFHKPKSWSPRPSQAELLDAVPIEEISMQWADHKESGLRFRLMVIFFADDRFLLQYTVLGPALGKKKKSHDEADAILGLLGDRAVEVEVPDA